MTLRDLQQMIEEAVKEDPANLDCMVVLPKETHIPGLYGFEDVCPGISGMIEVGESPAYMDDARKENKDKPMFVFLIAPHSMHDDSAHETEKQKLQN